MLFFFVLSTIFVVSSIHWFWVWFFLEINTLIMCYLFSLDTYVDKTSLSVVLMYYFFQVFSSFLILISLLKKNIFFLSMEFVFYYLGVFVKMGLWPFHSWFLKMVYFLSMENKSLLIMMTWQKIMPMFLLLFIQNLSFSFYLLFMFMINMLVSLVNLKNSFSMKEVVGLSSMNMNSWLIVLINCSLFLWKVLLMVYSLSIMLLFIYSKIKNEYNIIFNSLFFFLVVLNLSGMPPLFMFWTKLMVMVELLFMGDQKELVFFMMLSSCYLVFFYIYMLLNEQILLNVKKI